MHGAPFPSAAPDGDDGDDERLASDGWRPALEALAQRIEQGKALRPLAADALRTRQAEAWREMAAHQRILSQLRRLWRDKEA